MRNVYINFIWTDIRLLIAYDEFIKLLLHEFSFRNHLQFLNCYHHTSRLSLYVYTHTQLRFLCAVRCA
jgi:hypothetical protein